MAEGNWSVIRVEKISAEGAQKTERHNERKNENYANLNVDTERIARNVHFKDTGGLTYNEYFQRLIDEGKISTRGQKAGATIFNELVVDVNTRYFEEHGGYEYAKQFYEEAYRFGCEIYGEDSIVSAVILPRFGNGFPRCLTPLTPKYTVVYARTMQNSMHLLRSLESKIHPNQ